MYFFFVLGVDEGGNEVLVFEGDVYGVWVID